MSATPRRRRRTGSLGALKSSLWACIEYNLAVIDDHDLDHELRQHASHALVQAALAYSRLIEQHELQRQVTDLEHLAARHRRNGHHPS